MSNKVAITTKHGKIDQIAPAFSGQAQWEFELAPIDTDLFGTFTGEVERSLPPRETAIEKARAGAKLLECDYGIGSEGTIGPHPLLPFVNANYELMAFVCLSRGVAIVESFLSTSILAHSELVTSSDDLDATFVKFDLPRHAVNIIATNGAGRSVVKGVRQPNEARSVIARLLEDGHSEVQVESDFRAMSSPSRQANITKCAEALAARVAATCPACSLFGWGEIGFEYGVPCLACGTINSSIARAVRLGCQGCENTELVELAEASVDPSRCVNCNP
jgi:hypothetical protein